MAKHYNNLSLAEKERHNRPHEPPVRCPECDMAIQPDDLLAHASDRCKGRPEPHPRSRWLSWSEAISSGLTKRSLGQLALSGKIRTRQRNAKNQYLKRDVVRCVIVASGRGPAQPRPLSRPSGNSAARMPLGDATTKRLLAAIELAGSQSAAAELIAVPLSTVKRAIRGLHLRHGTRLAIELGIDSALKGIK